MGTLVSKAKLLLYATYQFNETYNSLKKKLDASPGLPVPNPTLPLWTIPAANIPGVGSAEVPPERADVVVIGSGITGTSFAYNALAREGALDVVMLEAREVCSGATGRSAFVPLLISYLPFNAHTLCYRLRNGGHINPPLYHDYAELKEKYGQSAAKTLIAFRCAHITEMMRVASEEDIVKESQVRETEHLDVFTCLAAFQEAKENLDKWRAEMPVESSSFVSYERREAIEVCHTVATSNGSLTQKAFFRDTVSPMKLSGACPTLGAQCTHTVL